MNLKSKENFYMQGAIETKSFVEGTSDGYTISGYASTRDLDRGNDVVLPEAFIKSLNEFLGINPQLLYQHDTDLGVGYVEKGEITDKGLYVEAKVVHNVQVAGVGLFERLEKGTVGSFSIGFRPLKFDFVVDGEVVGNENGLKKAVSRDAFMNSERHIKELELLEISIVNIPMNKTATFEVVKKSLDLSRDTLANKFFESKELGEIKEIQEEVVEEVTPVEEVVIVQEDLASVEEVVEETTTVENTDDKADELKNANEALQAKVMELEQKVAQLSTPVNTLDVKVDTTPDKEKEYKELMSKYRFKI